jgi:hypothetical protein
LELDWEENLGNGVLGKRAGQCWQSNPIFEKTNQGNMGIVLPTIVDRLFEAKKIDTQKKKELRSIVRVSRQMLR